ncbi:unnamed protein product [Blepharisma stoltei]|uniref:Transmembrane protein n=1 Tax=Blepharisma stoltei TaxID=1481888 RepID=A0AAU9K3Y9_9CILI|nr:unnamed protein product [Blepharisma stoltei]
MGIIYLIFYFSVLISACASTQFDENKNIFKNSSEASGFLSKSSSLVQNYEKLIFEQIDFEKSSRNLNVTNTTDSPKWIDTKGTSPAQAYICIATLIIYGFLLILSWKKDKKEAKEESELIIKKKGTPIKLEVTKKYIENTKEFRSFSIIFEDKNKLMEKKIFDLGETERENSQENENKESETNYERKIENASNNSNIKVDKSDYKENDQEIIYENENIEEKSNENLNDPQNKENLGRNLDTQNQNEMNEDIEGNVSLSFLAPDEVYIYKQETKKDEKLTYSLFLTKKSEDKPKTSWKVKVKKHHSLLSIFYYKNPRRTRLFFVTLYTLVLIGQMLFIGLFYLNTHTSTVKTVKDTNTSDQKKKPKTLDYGADDFFIMLFCVFVMLVIMIIIDLMCLEREIKENMSADYSNKIRKTNFRWRIAGLVICWGLIGLFCWVIIQLCNDYEKSISMVWLTSTLISYAIKICIFSFFENDLVAWLASLPEKLRKYFERKHEMEDQEIDDNNEAVKDKKKYNEQVEEIA